jgi:hypothetical protein
MKDDLQLLTIQLANTLSNKEHMDSDGVASRFGTDIEATILADLQVRLAKAEGAFNE